MEELCRFRHGITRRNGCWYHLHEEEELEDEGMSPCCTLGMRMDRDRNGWEWRCIEGVIQFKHAFSTISRPFGLKPSDSYSCGDGRGDEWMGGIETMGLVGQLHERVWFLLQACWNKGEANNRSIAAKGMYEYHAYECVSTVYAVLLYLLYLWVLREILMEE